MSTSDRQRGAPGPPKDGVWNTEQWISERVIDPAVLARMANEFFTALPEFTQVSSAGPVAAPQEVAPPTSVPSQRNVPLATTNGGLPVGSVAPLAEMRNLPTSLRGPSESSLASAASSDPTPLLPAISGDLSETAFPVSPSFSFLKEARSIFGTLIAAASGSQQPLSLLQEFEKSAAVQVTPNLATLLSDIPAKDAPTVSGAPIRPAATDWAASYGFLNETRQLLPSEVATILEADNYQPDELPDLGLSSRSFEVGEIRRDFPILQERVNARPLIWLDNAATTQKPQSVIDRLNHFYAHENSNIHRAAHELAARATDAYEAAREKVRRFLNASSSREIVFVRGATEGINLVAQSWGRQNIRKDDEIVVTWLEHHANIVPWQMLCAERGARLRVAPVDDTGQILLDEYTKLVGPRTRLVSLAHVSNALGTITPAREMIEIAHRHGATVLLDGAQAVSHMPVDVQVLDCDFYVFSGHKVFAPTGIGAVYGKSDILEYTQPWQGGGSMIVDVTFEKTVYNVPPGRFEAGTGSIADAVGLGAAIDYVQRLGMSNIARYEHDLLVYATEAISKVPGLRLIGTAKEKASVLSFVLDGFRTEDIGAALNREGIAVRAGHHCAQPIHRRFGVESSVRASLALYNTCEEVDALVAALWNLKQGHRSSLS